MKPNSKRFIEAFNQIDYSLRTHYNIKRSLSFSDMVRKSTSFSSIIRKFEEDLIDYSRLRNAIIHNSNDEITIAEPHDEVTDKIERIAKIISTPPTVLDTVCKKGVLAVDYNVKVIEVIKLIAKSGFSNIPVYKNSCLIGVANGQKILNELGIALEQKNDLTNFITSKTIEEIIKPTEFQSYYALADAKLTIEEALNMFYSNRKLLVILVSRTGDMQEPTIGIVTASDIMDMNTILDSY
ncbi:MAG: hypothetical protein WCR30_04645 [Clostridia bacterium]